MRCRHWVGLCILLALAALPASAQVASEKQWEFEAFTGSAYNFPTHLTIEQAGQPDISLRAHYATKPFEEALYYAVRIGRWEGDRAWELELLHHKLYLTNNPSEVQHFEVTHGYNLLMVNRARLEGEWIYRFGGGAVISHTESVIRNQPLDAGYELAGVCAQIAAERKFPLSRQLFAAVEGKLTAAYARVDVASGHANVPNIAVHGLIGIGYAF